MRAHAIDLTPMLSAELRDRGISAKLRAMAKKKGLPRTDNPLIRMVGDTGFEPVTPAV